MPRQTQTLDDIVGVNTVDVLYTTREGTERLERVRVTSNAFDFLGIPPIRGRGLLREDGRTGALPVFVMSYKMWAKYCNQDPQVLGKTFVFNNEGRTLVGIMPPRFTYFAGDIWYPRDPDLAEPDADRNFFFCRGAESRESACEMSRTTSESLPNA